VSARGGQLDWGRYSSRTPTFSDWPLSATLFIKTALTLRKKTPIEDMRSRGLIREIRLSLEILRANTLRSQLRLRLSLLLSVAFYRGLAMLVAVERDTEQRSNYPMITINPIVPRPPMKNLLSTLLMGSLTEPNSCWKLSIMPLLTGNILAPVMWVYYL